MIDGVNITSINYEGVMDKNDAIFWTLWSNGQK